MRAIPNDEISLDIFEFTVSPVSRKYTWKKIGRWILVNENADVLHHAFFSLG